jgi:DNA-binding HxlR family transcriptional regulator
LWTRACCHEYRLTDKGRDVYPILAAMAAFGDKWLLGSNRPVVTCRE